MNVKLSLTINFLLITVAISDRNLKTKLKLLQRNSLSVQQPFTSSDPPLLHVISCFVQDVRIMALIVVNNSNADVVDGLLRHFYKQFNVPILLSWVDDKDNPQTEIRRDTCNQCAEINIAYIIMVDDVTILDRLWGQIKNAQFVWNREANFLLLLTSPPETTAYGSTLEFLWKKHKMLHVMILPIFTNIRNQVDYKVMFYQPFVQINSNTFGELQLIDAKNVCNMKETVSNKLQNMNGYPFNVSMFARGSFVNKTTNKTEFYYGQDGYILSELASYMGFSATIHHPPLPKDFGFYYSNGTSTGTLGFVLHGKAEIAFNARFIKNYGTKAIAFTSAIFNDDLCIIVPKAGYIPKWLAMVISFDKYIYAMIVLFYLACGTLWYVFKKFSIQYCKGGDETDAISIFLDNLHPYVGMSFTHIPKATSERMLMTCSLILGLILASGFQGQLVNVISKPNYHPDINTLKQLDKSGLRITTSSQTMYDSFSDTGSAVLDHLRNKLTVVNDSFGQDRVARRGNVAAVVRKSTVDVGQSNRRFDGSKLVHLVGECPRSYHLAYVMFKHSPYLSTVNRFLIRIYESGIITQLISRSHYDLTLLLGGNTSAITKDQEENVTKVFTFEDLQLPFILLAAGLALACLVFLTEML